MGEDEVAVWFERGKDDLNTARYLFDGGIYYASAFYCQQSVEKLLKAFLLKLDEKLIKTHSIRKLSRILELPVNLQNKISVLEDVERLARYPISDEDDARYTKEDVKNFLNICEEVLVWIKGKMML